MSSKFIQAFKLATPQANHFNIENFGPMETIKPFGANRTKKAMTALPKMLVLPNKAWSALLPIKSPYMNTVLLHPHQQSVCSLTLKMRRMVKGMLRYESDTTIQSLWVKRLTTFRFHNRWMDRWTSHFIRANRRQNCSINRCSSKQPKRCRWRIVYKKICRCSWDRNGKPLKQFRWTKQSRM